MNNHDIIIAGLTSIIVIIQLMVFANTFLKIRSFRNILPPSTLFRTVTVFLTEEEIRKLPPSKIITEAHLYQNRAEEKTTLTTHIWTEDDTNIDNKLEDEIWDKGILFDDESWIYIVKADERKRIKFKNLNLYKADGWLPENNQFDQDNPPF